MSTSSTDPSLLNGAHKMLCGLVEVAKATYNLTAPAVVSATKIAGHVTVTYVVPAVVSAGSTVMTLVKGKPSAPTAEEFDVREKDVDGFTLVDNGTELPESSPSVPSVPF